MSAAEVIVWSPLFVFGSSAVVAAVTGAAGWSAVLGAVAGGCVTLLFGAAGGGE